MNLDTTGKNIVEEVPYGMYVWECPDGEILGDDDGNIMNVFCMKGDRRAIEALTAAAKHYGFEAGKVVWWSGKRRITDEQLEEQEARARMGLVPDPLDFGAIKDTERGLRNND
jgi:hypothetical protein